MKTDKLPSSVATRNMDGKPIIIVNGEEGYHLAGESFPIDKYNAIIGATKAEIDLMVAGSMFGFDIAAIANYEPETRYTEVK